VLVHGAWHGAWCWKYVVDQLRSMQHTVFTPTLTGLGEKRHLMSRNITLNTFTSDVSNLLEMEDLSEVVLVGHSFGGSPVSGTADRLAERIKHVVYLDSMIVQPGKTPFDALTPEAVAIRIKLAQDSSGGLSLPAPPADAFGINNESQAKWVGSRLTPHPLSSFMSPLEILGPVGNGLPCTYIGCVDPAYGALNASREWAKAQGHFRYLEMQTGHDAMVTAPAELAKLLVELGK
jgi:pimeloyl-ACP methyl ester carboxylesterase